MREKLSKRAQKFYRTNPEAYLELKEIEQRGTRICPGCEKEVELSLLECPECRHILRTSRWKDAWKWILGGTLLLMLGSGGSMILFFGNIPACDDPEPVCDDPACGDPDRNAPECDSLQNSYISKASRNSTKNI